MNTNRRPTLEEISLYYDGLLQGEAKDRVEAFLNANPETDPMMRLFQDFECAQENDISEAEVDRLLANNLQEIHSRIYKVNQSREIGWFYLLSPRFICGTIAVLLCLAIGISMLERGDPSMNSPLDTPKIAQAPERGSDTPEIGPAPTVPTTMVSAPDVLKERDVQVNEVQKQAILTMALYAKSALNTGMETVAEKSRGVSQNLALLDENTPLAFDVVRSALDQPAFQAQGDTIQATNSSTEALAKLGRQQLALGLGASMISMISVF